MQLLLRLRSTEVQKRQISFLLYRIEEQIESGTLFLCDQKFINDLEEFALQFLDISAVFPVYDLRNRI